MKLQFDAKQAYQVDAVSAVVDLFDGQPLNKPDYAVVTHARKTSPNLAGFCRQKSVAFSLARSQIRPRW